MNITLTFERLIKTFCVMPMILVWDCWFIRQFKSNTPLFRGIPILHVWLLTFVFCLYCTIYYIYCYCFIIKATPCFDGWMPLMWTNINMNLLILQNGGLSKSWNNLMVLNQGFIWLKCYSLHYKTILSKMSSQKLFHFHRFWRTTNWVWI